MKLTLSWLADYLDMSAPAQTTADDIITALTALGLEVDDVENRAELYSPFTVCKVVSAEKHPDADRLKVCQVETKDGMVQVVCGAPNARAGMTGIFAPVGSYIPGLDVTLEKGKIRGQDSNGMLVSEREMNLSDDHDGIIDLDDHHALGTPIAAVFEGLDDIVIEIGLTPDRADCAGIMGIARDLAAAGCGTFIPPTRPEITEHFETKIHAFTDTADTCPHFLGRHIRGVENGESPAWLKKRLEAIGLRPISALVDITNYFCIGLNRPLHVYDVNKLQGGIRVKLADGGESFAALNDKSYTLTGGETVITDDSGVLGLGGIVGGTSTGCDAGTTDVFVECAYFDPVSTAVTGRKHQIISDARYRFERGVDPAFLPDAMDLATQMILDLCGGEAGSVVTAGQAATQDRLYDFDPALTQRLTGVEIPEQEQLFILGTLGFEIDGGQAPYQIKAPSWRPDIMGKADIVEEVIRIHGYDKIEPVPVVRETQLTQNALSPLHHMRVKAGRILANRGLQECITWSFIAHDLAQDFTAGGTIKPGLRLSNPLSTEMDTMRPSALPNLIQAAARNADRGYPNAALFEVGPVFHGVNPDDQMTVAAGVRHGMQADKHWASDDVSRTVDAYDAKADALAAIQAVNPSLNPQLSQDDLPSYFHPGRSGVYRLGKNILAVFGEIHPMILEKIDVSAPLVGFEVYLDNIPATKKGKGAAKSPLTLSPLQPVSKDFAFLVNEDIAADSVMGAVSKGAGKMMTQARIFDVYQGKGVPEGQKSIAVAVEWVPTDKTLTDEDIESLMTAVVDQVTAKTGGTLRG